MVMMYILAVKYVITLCYTRKVWFVDIVSNFRKLARYDYECNMLEYFSVFFIFLTSFDKFLSFELDF